MPWEINGSAADAMVAAAIWAPTSATAAAVTSASPRRLRTFWNNLERNYREDVARIEERGQLAKQTSWLKQFPLSDMFKLRAPLRSFDDPIDQLEELLRQIAEDATVEAPGAGRTSDRFTLVTPESRSVLPDPAAPLP